MLLADRVAIITGGARGIGKGIALKFAEEGCSIVIADILMKEANASLAEIKEKGRDGLAVQCDISDSRQVQDMVEKTIKKFGKIDILVNCAGIGGDSGPMENIPLDEWDRVVAVNLKGTFLCCRAVIPHMKEKRYGRIINISSGVAVSPISPRIHYVASKAGVLGITLDLSLELAAFNICVNAIMPGPVRTELWDDLKPKDPVEADKFFEELGKKFVPMERIGVPEDIAGVALFFASALSSFVTGSQIYVGGGLPHRYLR